MAEPHFWQSRRHPLGWALMPFSWLYQALEAANRKWTHSQHPGKPVICVGNLTAGGAGKTPTVQWLAAQLSAQNMRPAILSRGYGGQKKGPLKVDPRTHTARDVGDEPLMLAQDWPVYICADRMQSLRLAVQDGADVLIKDDGFQNPAMAHHFNLIVVDGASGLGNQRLLPSGPMRQPLAVALEKIDALLVLGEARHESVALLMDAVEAFDKPVFHAHIRATQKGEGRVHGFCGIAKPEKFRASLTAQGYEIAGFTAFGDHYEFTDADAAKLLAQGETLITTQKDMARLKGAAPDTPRGRLAAQAQILPIRLEVENQDALMRAIESALAQGQANRLYKSY